MTDTKTSTKDIADNMEKVKAANGALDKIEAVLLRMKELAELSESDKVSGMDRVRYQREVAYLKGELDFICNTAEYEGELLFAGRSES